MVNDWRITNQINYLNGVTLKFVDFDKVSKNEHEHCEFCFEKFGYGKEFLHYGYCTLDGYHWVCENCYNDFKSLFHWKTSTQ